MYARGGTMETAQTSLLVVCPSLWDRSCAVVCIIPCTCLYTTMYALLVGMSCMCLLQGPSIANTTWLTSTVYNDYNHIHAIQPLSMYRLRDLAPPNLRVAYRAWLAMCETGANPKIDKGNGKGKVRERRRRRAYSLIIERVR